MPMPRSRPLSASSGWPGRSSTYKLFCEDSASQDAPGRVPSPDAADLVSAAPARRHGRDPEAAAGVSGITTQLLMLPTAVHIPNMGVAYAAVLEQARLAHEDFTGNKGPSLEPVLLAQGHGVAGGGGVAPRMAWGPGSAGFNLAGMTMPSAGAAAPAPAAGPSARGPPISHGGYAGVDPGGLAPSPAESVGHELRARAASRSAERSRPPPVRAPSGSRGEESEWSPKEVRSGRSPRCCHC